MRQPWIGLVEVASKPGYDELEGAAGAYVNVVALAADENEFRDLVAATMQEYHFTVLDVSDVSLISERVQGGDLVPQLEVLAGGLTEQFPIQFDEFQAYDEE